MQLPGADNRIPLQRFGRTYYLNAKASPSWSEFKLQRLPTAVMQATDTQVQHQPRVPMTDADAHAMMWHRRLGHAGMTTLERMSK